MLVYSTVSIVCGVSHAQNQLHQASSLLQQTCHDSTFLGFIFNSKDSTCQALHLVWLGTHCLYFNEKVVFILCGCVCEEQGTMSVNQFSSSTMGSRVQDHVISCADTTKIFLPWWAISRTLNLLYPLSWYNDYHHHPSFQIYKVKKCKNIRRFLWQRVFLKCSNTPYYSAE